MLRSSAVATELTPSELMRRDANVECSRTRRPRFQHPQSRLLMRLVPLERACPTMRDHTPTVVVLAIELVDLERDLVVMNEGRQRSVRGSAEDDGAIVDGEVDKVNLGAFVGAENHSTDGMGREPLQALPRG